MRQWIAAVLAAFAFGCATGPPPPPPEPFTEVPTRALEALCSYAVRGGGIGRETMIHVVDTSRPLITEASLHSLASAFAGSKLVRRPDLTADVLPVRIPATGCLWHPVKTVSRTDRDRYFMEVSAPIANPFSKTQSGLFARLSLGDQAPSWYWVPLLSRNGRVGVGAVIPLDLRE